jgi:hypothetical protein
MYVLIDIQVNLHISFNIQVNVLVFDNLQFDLHQTCTHIDEFAYIYMHTHKDALKNEYLDEYACIYAYTGEYIVI